MSKYVVVVKRAVPVNDYSTDTVTGIWNKSAPIGEIMKWVEKLDQGGATVISVEITKPEVEGSD